MKYYVLHDNDEIIQPGVWTKLLWNTKLIDDTNIYIGFDAPFLLPAGFYAVSLGVIVRDPVVTPIELRLRGGQTPDFGGTGTTTGQPDAVITVGGLTSSLVPQSTIAEIRHHFGAPLRIGRVKDIGPALRIASL